MFVLSFLTVLQNQSVLLHQQHWKVLYSACYTYSRVKWVSIFCDFSSWTHCRQSVIFLRVQFQKSANLAARAAKFSFNPYSRVQGPKRALMFWKANCTFFDWKKFKYYFHFNINLLKMYFLYAFQHFVNLSKKWEP